MRTTVWWENSLNWGTDFSHCWRWKGVRHSTDLKKRRWLLTGSVSQPVLCTVGYRHGLRTEEEKKKKGKKKDSEREKKKKPQKEESLNSKWSKTAGNKIISRNSKSTKSDKSFKKKKKMKEKSLLLKSPNFYIRKKKSKQCTGLWKIFVEICKNKIGWPEGSLVEEPNTCDKIICFITTVIKSMIGRGLQKSSTCLLLSQHWN